MPYMTIGSDWGGVSFGLSARIEDVGHWEMSRHPYLDGTGIPEFLKDFEEMGRTFIAHLNELASEKRLELLKLYR